MWAGNSEKKMEGTQSTLPGNGVVPRNGVEVVGIGVKAASDTPTNGDVGTCTTTSTVQHQAAAAMAAFRAAAASSSSSNVSSSPPLAPPSSHPSYDLNPSSPSHHLRHLRNHHHVGHRLHQGVHRNHSNTGGMCTSIFVGNDLLLTMMTTYVRLFLLCFKKI